ncbi:LacI family DNA-binding transcriptional regulator [Saccharibacillus sp. CPCC 101409]|uniref:LacI family DNA-binding transcriptional regulator n=1 Tax=Saccharibacillus sp. CPCC 101409 TaxID=3058041 RepID=UPI0026731699|nr:LacI family DNA-binding transcriptional regulator [Saccharibacillus sp. CPCC 101409]MDO3411465.1 LacI family DNA-binding transcriptional regulator [Saccharibacillus sp. CPCC 101409]
MKKTTKNTLNNPPKTKVTMQDIADRLGISKNSVSQALSGKDGVSEETRRTVVRTAAEMGYAYSENRGRRREDSAQESGSIALIASDFAFSQKGFFGEIYLTIEDEAARRGKNLLIQSVSRQAADSLTLPSFIESGGVEGVLILSHITTGYIRKVIDTGIPTVLIDHHHPFIRTDCILTNNRFSAYEAVRHLAELGHSRLGFIGNTALSPSYDERLDGFRLAQRELGLPESDESWIVRNAEEDSEFVGRLVRRLEASDRMPTAWFCVNDGFGYYLNSALQQAGLRVPQDVSVVSFDNGYLSRLAVPPITTLDVDLALYGRRAVARLLERIERPDEPFTELLLPTKLLTRGSSGPAPDAEQAAEAANAAASRGMRG